MLCARSMSIHTRRVPQWFARRSGGHTAAESFRAHAAAQSRGLPRLASLHSTPPPPHLRCGDDRAARVRCATRCCVRIARRLEHLTTSAQKPAACKMPLLQVEPQARLEVAKAPTPPQRTPALQGVHHARGIACASSCRWLEGAGQGNGAGIPTDLDAIIVLGGGQDVDAEHRLPPWVERRLDTAADLQALQTDRTCRILLSGGGVPLDTARPATA